MPLAPTTNIEWKPVPKQEALLALPDSIFEALYGGAAGGGKSEVLLILPLIRGWHENPRFKGILFRRTYPELERELINRSHTWYPAAGGVYISDKKCWRFPSRAELRFGHMEYEKDARTYDSDEYNYIGFDELTHFTEFQYTYLFSRCRTSAKDLPAIMRSGTNPGNIGHAWVRNRFIEPNGKPLQWGTVIKDRLTGLKRIFIQSLLTDNNHIDPDYINKLGLLPEAERRAKRDGDWYTFEGQVFSDWRENRVSSEPPEALHVCEPFDIPDWWPKFLAIDWGYAANTVAYWGTLSPNNRLYVYREYSCTQTRISSWASDVKRITGSEKLDSVVLCASAWQKRGDEETISDQFRRVSGFTPRPADNARLAGKILIQEYLRFAQKPESRVLPISSYDNELAMRLLRQQGMVSYQAYLDSFKESPREENLPKLQVFNTCEGLIRTIPLCVYEKNEGSTGKPAEDVREFIGDDFYDAFRYLVMQTDKYVTDSLQSEGNYRERVAAASQSLILGGDQTSFYRKMEKIERDQQPVVRPIRRLHRGR